MRKGMIDRLIAGVLVMVMAFILPAVHVHAAEKETTYIKEFKLYIDENKDPAAVKDWFEKNGYTMIEGNLNEDASGALKKEVGVYLGYSTTTDKKEAVRDLAVMNERGNYSQSEYKRILEDQKKMYDDMVSDLKSMLEEYRTNVNNGVPTAIQSRDFLNGYKEDDSDQLLGDLLMTISDEDLGKLLMQANGQIVLMIEDRLAYACESGKSNWLDRMVKLGSYKNLEKKALKASGNDITKANKALDKKYKEAAIVLADNWGDMEQHFRNLREKLASWDIGEKSADEINQFFADNKENSEVAAFVDEFNTINMLANYTYEDGTLMEFFDQPASAFKGDGIRKLYPLAASLNQGQISATDQMVSIFALVLDAINAGNFNDYQSGATKDILEELTEEDSKAVEETQKKVEDAIDTWNKQPVTSVYEGVDREVFKDGVAVTSTAQKFSNDDGVTWVDAFVDRGYFTKAAIGLAAGSAIFATLAILTASKVKFLEKVVIHNLYDRYGGGSGIVFRMPKSKEVSKALENGIERFEEDTSEILINREQHRVIMVDDVRVDFSIPFDEQSAQIKQSIIEKAGEVQGRDAASYRLFHRLKTAFTVASILLAVADIVMTSVTLYKYYNRDHLPIPSYMVDLSYDSERQTSFISYKSVTDQNNGYGDVNGGGGKQWLALYQTCDESAGDPILAPENGEQYKLVVQYGTADEPETGGYSPLHLFGTPNTAQNLTFADGESGWSYNDGKNGTYVFFRRDDGTVPNISTEEEKAPETTEEAKEETKEETKETAVPAEQAVSGSAADAGTSFGAGMVALIGVGCGAAGLIIGIIGTTAVRRKKRDDRS